MPIDITWLGHGCWLIAADEHRILLDPFLDDSPTAPIAAADVEATCILVSHGHFDHIADAAKVFQRTRAVVCSNFEICQWLGAHHGVDNAEPMNLGGEITLPFGRLALTVAHHSSQLPDGSDGGNPGGFLITIDGRRLYFACDTALFSDMALHRGVDLAVLPIGDRFTMGPDAALAAVKLIEPKFVLPAHYNTWPPIEQDAEAWAKRVIEETDAIPTVLAPGESFTLG